MLETSEKNSKFQQRNRNYKEEPNKKFRAEKYNKCKNSLDGLNS